MSVADHVRCTNCMKEMLVHVGEEICPNCKHPAGTLLWQDPDNTEVSGFDLREGVFIEVVDWVKRLIELSKGEK